MIGIVDCGCGNLRSLESALDRLGLAWKRVEAPGDLGSLERVILPGVGHFGAAMAELRGRGLDQALRDRAASGAPLLGICLGMQLLFEGSEEAPGIPGLGLLPGRFEAFRDPVLKVPHMGWNSVEWAARPGSAYFVHSFFLREWTGPASPELGWSRHGLPFIAAFRCGALSGFQFHPEKSSDWGLALLKEALTW